MIKPLDSAVRLAIDIGDLVALALRIMGGCVNGSSFIIGGADLPGREKNLPGRNYRAGDDWLVGRWLGDPLDRMIVEDDLVGNACLFLHNGQIHLL